MGRRSRLDRPGSWHHVMNRGLARRVAFVDAQGARFFLAQVARAVRRGEIEVYAFAVMGTHFHLLVRSGQGELATAMHRIQHVYVRWFNAREGRDGPLFRGRFKSRALDGSDDCLGVRAYVERNPVDAGIVSRPALYPFASARFGAADGPPWMTGLPDRPSRRRGQVVALEHLAGPPGSLIRRRLEALARVADGSSSLHRQREPAACMRACGEAMRRHAADWQDPPMSAARLAEVLRVAALRDLGRLSWDVVGEHASLSVTTARRRFDEHRRTLSEDPGYRGLFEAVEGVLDAAG